MGRSSRAKHEERARQAAAPGAAEPKQRSRARTAVLWVIVLVLPLLLLGSVEAGLRLAGFGAESEPLFVPAPQHAEYLQANPRVVTRFFTDPALAPSVSIETAFFAAHKPPGSFRVVVQGESSAAGFPYGLGASLAGALDRRLEQAFPEREIEVISTALAAVNSYALLDFADEIIATQPDAILVYVGHNEFLGILGVGSSMRLAATPMVTRAFLAVRDWRLFQLLSRFLTPHPVAQPGAGTSAADSLMARVAGERSIALRSSAFDQGVQQFEDNLDRLLAKYRAARIPVFIGTLVSNERDQLPLAVLAGAEDEVAGAAKTAYYAAQDAEAAGSFDAARDGYAWARDLDPLRFRAPSTFNAVVQRVAAAHGASIVDVHGAFVAASEHGLVGEQLVLEHVHPNLEGYFVLADAFFDALVDGGLAGTPSVATDEVDARAWMPVSAVDRLLGEYKVLRIRSTWPFAAAGGAIELPPATGEVEQLARDVYHERRPWAEAQEALRKHYRATGDVRGYAGVTLILADAFPFAGALQFESAAALIELGRAREAVRYSRRSVGLEPRNVNHWLVHAHGLLLTDRTAEGREALQKALEIEPGNATARGVLEQLEAR